MPLMLRALSLLFLPILLTLPAAAEEVPTDVPTDKIELEVPLSADQLAQRELVASGPIFIDADTMNYGDAAEVEALSEVAMARQSDAGGEMPDLTMLPHELVEAGDPYALERSGPDLAEERDL